MDEFDDMEPEVGMATTTAATILDEDDEEREKADKRSPLEDGVDALEPELGSVRA